MTARMIVPTSDHDSTARSPEENSETSEFQQFEFWVNGVKRTIKIPLQCEVQSEPTSESSSKVINVDLEDIDEVHSCTFSADPIVIDPDVNDDDDDGASCLLLSHKESVRNNTVALGDIGHFQIDQGALPQNNQSNVHQNDQISINTDSLSSALGSSRYENRSPLTIRSELEKRLVHNLQKSDAATCVNQSIIGQSAQQTDLSVINSNVVNSQALLRESLVPTSLSKNVSQSVTQPSNSNISDIPSELVISGKSNRPLNLSGAGYKALLQTVNSGIPVIMTNSTILGKDGNPVLHSSTSNGSASCVLPLLLQPNKMKSGNCFNSDGAVQLGLRKQATSQSSSMLMTNQSHYPAPTQPSGVQLRVADSRVNSNGANQSVNLPQFVALNGQRYDPTASSSSAPGSLGSSGQIRKVKITTDINGSCIISVDGLSPNTDKAINSNTSNILTTGSGPRRAVPYVIRDIFQRMHPNAIQSCQSLQLPPSDRRTLHSMSPDALGNPRPMTLESLNILQNDKAFCLKPPNCQALSMPPLSFSSSNVGLLGLEPSSTIHTGLAAQGRANSTQLVSGAACVAGSGRGVASLPVRMLSLCRLPSSLSMNVTGPPQPDVKCSSVACSASFNINSSALLSKLASSHISSVSPGLQSASFTPACLPRAIPLSGFLMHSNAVSIPSVKSTNDATGSSHNEPNPRLKAFQILHVPYCPPVTVYSSFLKSGCSISSVPQMSQNLVMSPVTRFIVNKDQVINPAVIVSKSLSESGAITKPGMKSVSSSLVSRASAWETPTFPQWSRPAINKLRDSLVPCKASMLPSSTVITVASCKLYSPAIYSQTSSTIADKCSNSFMSQAAGNTVPLFLQTKVFPSLALNVSSCPNNTLSHIAFSLAQQSNQFISNPQVTKSAVSFYNSHLKRPKPIPLSENMPSNTSINSAGSVTSVGSTSSQNISNGQTNVASSLIPISVKFYESSNISKKRKHKSNSRRRTGSCNTSSSSISDSVNLLSDPESLISSSESWSSDDSITIGKRRTRRRCRKLTKRRACESDEYNTRSLENSEANYQALELKCFVSLENLYLNGKTWVDIRESSENLVCCRNPTRRPMSTVNSLRQNVSRKKSYKLLTALNYLSETD